MASPPPSAVGPPKSLHPLHIHVKTSSPRFPPSPATPSSITIAISPSSRRIAIAVDLSDESAYAVKWAVENYIRPGDTVILLHVRSTSILYGADWGSSTPTTATSSSSSATSSSPSNNPFAKSTSCHQQVLEEEYDNFTVSKANHLAQPLVEAHVPVKIHIVKDHDMKERLCLEVERLGVSAVIMGSRGIGASRRSSKGKLGSVSDYCVQHCACPVVVVRYNNEAEEEDTAMTTADQGEEQLEYFHDADDRST